MPKTPKLKVYCTPIGFYDALVAAPSQRAALKAWGTSTDLFGAGRASVVDDPASQADALARPGEVIRRPRGDAATLIAAMEAEERAERAAPKTRPKSAAPPAPPPAPPPPDRSELDEAERALAEAEHRLDEDLRRFDTEREALDARETATRKAGETRLSDLTRARDRARTAYDRAVARGAR